jgi:adenylylsulfate kinase
MTRPGFTLWLTGRSGAGKTTLTTALLPYLGAGTEVLDGDEIRLRLSKGLGFSREDRDTNIDRISFVAERLSRQGVRTIVAAISPYRLAREQARARHERLGVSFIEGYVHCLDNSELLRRDPKGLYAKGVVSVTDDYEPPLTPELDLPSDRMSLDAQVLRIHRYLFEKGLL